MKFTLSFALILVALFHPVFSQAEKVTLRCPKWLDGADPNNRSCPSGGQPMKSGDQSFASYQEALGMVEGSESKAWKTPQDVNAWIGQNFIYDPKRASSGGMNSDNRPGGPLAPDKFFANPTGVCFDLAKFTHSTLRDISPMSNAKLVKVEFEPCVTPNKSVMKDHWMVRFEKDGQYFYTGDSRFPGCIHGPFDEKPESFKKFYDVLGRNVRNVQNKLVNMRPIGPQLPTPTPVPDVKSGPGQR